MREFECPPGHDPSKAYLEIYVNGPLARIENCYLPSNDFRAKGWYLVSAYGPCFSPSSGTFHVWGRNRRLDENWFHVPEPVLWRRFLERMNAADKVVLVLEGTLEDTNSMEEDFFSEMI